MSGSHSGFIIKEGGGVFKNWKKRWAILNPLAGTLSYFESKEGLDKPLGIVVVRGGTIQTVPKSIKGKNNCFSITSSTKVFFAYVDNEEDLAGWIEALNIVATSSVKGEKAEEERTLNLFNGYIVKLDIDKNWRKKWGLLTSTELLVFKNKTGKEREHTILLKNCTISFPRTSKYFTQTAPITSVTSSSSSGVSVFDSVTSVTSVTSGQTTPTPTSSTSEFTEDFLFFLDEVTDGGTSVRHHIIARTDTEERMWVEQIRLVTLKSSLLHSSTSISHAFPPPPPHTNALRPGVSESEDEDTDSPLPPPPPLPVPPPLPPLPDLPSDLPDLPSIPTSFPSTDPEGEDD